MVVLDASAGIELLALEGPVADVVERRIAPLNDVHVPELFDLEIMSALRGLERGGVLDRDAATEVLVRLLSLRANRWSHEETRADTWRRRHGHSIYDATYVALARLLDLPLVTTDRKLAEAAGDDVAVELLAA